MDHQDDEQRQKPGYHPEQKQAFSPKRLFQQIVGDLIFIILPDFKNFTDLIALPAELIAEKMAGQCDFVDLKWRALVMDFKSKPADNPVLQLQVKNLGAALDMDAAVHPGLFDHGVNAIRIDVTQCHPGIECPVDADHIVGTQREELCQLIPGQEANEKNQWINDFVLQRTNAGEAGRQRWVERKKFTMFFQSRR